MDIREVMNSGKLYNDYDVEEFADKRMRGRELVYEFNHSRPYEEKRRSAILRELFAEVGEGVYVEPPIHMSYGCNVHVGDHFYANFNLVIVDDIDVYIGDNVMFAPNVTISVTGHPVHPDLRPHGDQFSAPVHIGDRVWIGSNVVILPGVTIGENSVIGAGSVVTKDIPPNVVAVGAPCRVLRPITEEDRVSYAVKGERFSAEGYISTYKEE